MNELDPIVGNWYRNADSDLEFEVVAVDEDAQTIEIQYAEGEVEEIDLDTWSEMPLEAIEAPEDWSGPFDDLDLDDLGYSDDEGGPNNRAKDDPLKGLY
ncbi:MAG: hypothetical protein H6970_04690 [Gammaproteobacteria bacterium]|nr:hypothetical protein [Gammaproteobacteria bacterium]MCP5424346.1 hypothetical protein [Gammaproteobacteria bacterium]